MGLGAFLDRPIIRAKTVYNPRQGRFNRNILMSIHSAMILAAGRGERLRPLTDVLPKPLIRVGEYRLIEYHLRALATAGIHDVVINVAHLGDLIEQTLGDGAAWDVRIRYSREPEGALETAGGIHNALPLLGDEPFLVINGDVRCDFPLALLKLAAPARMHLMLVPNPAHHPQGDFSLLDDRSPGLLSRPSGGLPTYTYAGLGVYTPSLFAKMPAGRARLAPLIHHCIGSGQASGELYRGYWLDVGNTERLARARRDAFNHPSNRKPASADVQDPDPLLPPLD